MFLNKKYFVFVFILAVFIFMACECDSYEKPQHQVTLSAYKMDKYEVTASQFKECVTKGCCSTSNFKDTGSSNNYNISGRENHPMNTVLG